MDRRNFLGALGAIPLAMTAGLKPDPNPTALPSLTEIEAERGRRSLGYFLRHGWHVVEPGTTYIHGWHIDAIVEHLEAVWAREIRNLVINIPPRYMKSLTTSVFWPAWIWTNDASAEFLTTSYKQQLAVRDANKTRRLVQSGWYQQRWGHGFGLREDQNVKTHYENTQGGHRVSFGVGTGTGEGADIIIVDDPHDVEKAESQTERESALTWWDETMSTRLNDPDTGCKVIVMQRLHEEDLTGHVLAQGGYEHLMIPTEFEPDRKCVTSIGWEDSRTEEDELAWPERFGREAVQERKLRLGHYGTAGQLQQRPSPRGGGMFKRDWFLPVRHHNPPVTGHRIRYWDLAGTEDGGSYTAGVLMSWAPQSGLFFIEDVVRFQKAGHERDQRILQTAKADGTGVSVYVEQEPGSGGKVQTQAIIRLLSGFAVRRQSASGRGDKFGHADPLAAQAEAGNVKILDVKGGSDHQSEWVEPFLREMESAGPGAKYLDQMDAAAGAFNKLAADVHSGGELAPGALTGPQAPNPHRIY